MKFNRLTLIKSKVGKTRDNHMVSLWACDCGNTKEIAFSRVKNGYSKSCGCLVSETTRKNSTIHGMKNTREYRIWNGIRDRCLNKNSKDFERYKKRGIKICDRWNDFKKFYEDMGKSPTDKHSIDRIDNDGDYSPENCRWATMKQQASNRRGAHIWTVNGKKYENISDAMKEYGVSDTTIRRWCMGYKNDKGKYVPKIDNCFRERKYA